MISIAICDDDITIHEQLNEMIAAYSIINNQEIEIISFYSTQELLASTTMFEILFLDIRFDSYDVGIDAARILRENGNDYFIILLTTLNSKAIEGYEVGAYRYILKPINREQVFSLLASCIDKISNSSKVVIIKHRYGSDIVPINMVLYVESIARKRCLHTVNNTVDTWETLKSIYDQFPRGQFSYIQKGFVVNLARVTSFRKNNLVLNYDIELPISRQYKEIFFSQYSDFMGK